MMLTGVTIVVLVYTTDFVFCYENIALLKPTWQSKQYQEGRNIFHSSNGVDGLKTDLRALEGQCTISADKQRTATWWVNLTSVVSIHHVIIYHRTENNEWGVTNYCTSRALGFQLYISNTTSLLDGYLCFRDTIYNMYTIPAIVNISCPVHGQYVIYYNERLQGVEYPSGYSKYAFTDFCELEVYGCSPPMRYGPTCSFPCPANCKHYCHIESGNCFQCSSGYMGDHCDQQCNMSKYGVDCSQACGVCLDYKQCHHINGTCIEGCDRGYYGQLCTNACETGYFGYDCVEECSQFCKISRQCNHVTGSCKGGCKSGWQGKDCFQVQILKDKEHEFRFYGGLITLCFCALLNVVIVAVLCLKRTHKTTKMEGGNTAQNIHTKKDTTESSPGDYQELGELRQSLTYEAVINQ